MTNASTTVTAGRYDSGSMNPLSLDVLRSKNMYPRPMLGTKQFSVLSHKLILHLGSVAVELSFRDINHSWS